MPSFLFGVWFENSPGSESLNRLSGLACLLKCPDEESTAKSNMLIKMQVNKSKGTFGRNAMVKARSCLLLHNGGLATLKGCKPRVIELPRGQFGNS
jgi:hypothetical protein